jgi:hypothetical protein
MKGIDDGTITTSPAPSRTSMADMLLSMDALETPLDLIEIRLDESDESFHEIAQFPNGRIAEIELFSKLIASESEKRITNAGPSRRKA